MKLKLAWNASLIVGVVWLLAVGCSKEVAPPKPIALEQAPSSLQEAFKGANSDLKRLVDAAVGSLGTKDYTKALFALQTLAARSDLTPQQRQLAARSTLAVNQALSDQANSGDQQAQQVLQFQRTTK